MLPVNEVFETIQGEATYTGTPSVFIRLQGCDVGCPWCDTKHTWAKNAAHQMDQAAMLAKPGDGPAWAQVEVGSLVAIAANHKARHVVITGGEPCDYDLTELTATLLDIGKTVQVETSGTAPVRVAARTWVTVSPKVNMPGGKPLLREALQRADELKMPVGKQADIDALQEIISQVAHAHGGRYPVVWLQPLSTSEKATALCAKAATLYGWRLSVQTHKYAGLR